MTAAALITPATGRRQHRAPDGQIFHGGTVAAARLAAAPTHGAPPRPRSLTSSEGCRATWVPDVGAPRPSNQAGEHADRLLVAESRFARSVEEFADPARSRRDLEDALVQARILPLKPSVRKVFPQENEPARRRLVCSIVHIFHCPHGLRAVPGSVLEHSPVLKAHSTLIRDDPIDRISTPRGSDDRAAEAATTRWRDAARPPADLRRSPATPPSAVSPIPA